MSDSPSSPVPSPPAKPRGGFSRWFTDRLPIKPVLHWAFDEEVRGGSSFSYVFGACLLFLFALQVLTGIWQLFFYIPSLSEAYSSVFYQRVLPPLGAVISNIHFWGSYAFVFVLFLHISQVFIWGAYKKPRQLIWLLGSCLMALVLFMTFIGPRLLGHDPEQFTLSAFFALHVAVVPIVIAFFVLLHVAAFRNFGNVGPWDPAKRQFRQPFWPRQVAKDFFALAILFFALSFLASFVSPDSIATDRFTSYNTPYWQFLFIDQTAQFFPGFCRPLVTILLPLLLFFIIFFLPFYDRSTEKNPRKRPLAMLCYFLLLAFVITFTILACRRPSSVPLPSAPPVPSRSEASAIPVASRLSSGPSAVHQSDSQLRGLDLFKTQGCTGCHSIVGVHGGTIGPDLSNESASGRTSEYITQQIRNPRSHNPSSMMPPFADLKDTQVSDLVNFLLSLKGSAPTLPAESPKSLS